MVNNYNQRINRKRNWGRPIQEIEKDRRRIQEIISKAMWVIDDMIKLATTQCKLITSYSKAQGRYQVAEEILGSDSPVTKIFKDRAQEL